MHFAHKVYLWDLYDSQNKVIFFLRKINYLIFVMETRWVLFEVRTVF
jgi:hypothetical protein